MNLLMWKIIHYQKTLIGSRGIIDKVRDTFNDIYRNIEKNDFIFDESFIQEFSSRPFIGNISVSGNSCFIEFFDEGGFKKTVVFSPIFSGDEYKKRLYTYDRLIFDGHSVENARYYAGSYIYRSKCHIVTLMYLKTRKHDENLRAITSLCVNDNNYLFYHSYIWNKSNNMIYDFAMNICMDKEMYDSIFLYKEINVLSYEDFCNYSKCELHNKKKYYSLYFFGLTTLYNEHVANSKLNNTVKCLKKKFFR